MPHTPKEPVTSTALNIILRAFSCLSDLFFAPTISKRPLLIFDENDEEKEPNVSISMSAVDVTGSLGVWGIAH